MVWIRLLGSPSSVSIVAHVCSCASAIAEKMVRENITQNKRNQRGFFCQSSLHHRSHRQVGRVVEVRTHGIVRAQRSGFEALDDAEEAGLGHFGANLLGEVIGERQGVLAPAGGRPQDDAVASVFDDLGVADVLAEPVV